MGAQRTTELDGFRGLAVLLVVVSHVSNDLSLFGGKVGVTMFFVLSGFLITRNLQHEHDRSGRIDVRAFVRRRAARLSPALLLVLLVGVVMVILVGDPWATDVARTLPWIALPLANVAVVQGADLGPFAHFWSLAVEEQFYLVWPVLMLLLLRSRGTGGRAALAVVLALTVTALTWRAVANAVLEPSWVAHGLDTSAYALLLGASIAFAQRHITRALPSWLGLGALVVLVALTIGPSLTVTVRPSAIGLWIEPIAAVLTATVIAADPRRLGLLRLRPLRWFGTISYGLYLWHFLLLTVAPAGEPPSGAARLGVAAISVGVAAASWYLLERPVLQRVRRAVPVVA